MNFMAGHSLRWVSHTRSWRCLRLADARFVFEPCAEARDLEREVWKRTKAKLPDIAKEVVVTHVDSICRDQKGKPQPFVRICDTNVSEARMIAELIEGLIDIEIVAINRFIPKKP